MVERLNGIQEVGSSNLLPSTKSGTKKGRAVSARFFVVQTPGTGRSGGVRRGGEMEPGRNARAARFRKDGARGGTRTPTGCPTCPSNMRVCQFHHPSTGIALTSWLTVEDNTREKGAWQVFSSDFFGRAKSLDFRPWEAQGAGP